MWSAGRLSEALTYYQTCLNIRPDNPKVLYNMGSINRSQNQTDTAIQLFTDVITRFGDSEYADRARSQLAELQPQSQPVGAAGEAETQPVGMVTPTETEAETEADTGAGTGEPASPEETQPPVTDTED